MSTEAEDQAFKDWIKVPWPVDMWGSDAATRVETAFRDGFRCGAASAAKADAAVIERLEKLEVDVGNLSAICEPAVYPPNPLTVPGIEARVMLLEGQMRRIQRGELP